MAPPFEPLQIGALVFPNIDQADLTGPFEVLANLPNSSFHLLWKETTPVRDMKGLVLTPDLMLSECPPLDVLIVPGGRGQEALMDDNVVLAFVSEQAAQVTYILSVCTGALLCGAAGLLRGRKATTHWASHHLLPYFGAIPVDERVVVDGNLITAAGVTSGIDGALRVAALLRGDKVAQTIQLCLEYDPQPPFPGGSPQKAPSELVEAARAIYRPLTETRLISAKRAATQLGINVE
ncbi:MAG: DJ-1/PfpI family protein [Terracidiphilus sp.]